VHDLPPGVTLTAYRLLQEALTNVRRHAGSVEHVDVRMRRSCDRLDLAVTDDGRGAAADHGTPGYGIVGMRERVSALGGVMEAGPHRGGGWRVAVSLPLGPGATLGRPA
jgi:signal transduction histidine kinase